MLIGFGVLATVGIFVLDCILPLGVADGMLYMIPVLMGLWIPDKRYTYVSAGICGLLIIVGYFVSPPGGVSWMVITNRTLAVIVVWVSAAVCLLQKRTQEKLDRENAFTRLLQSVAVAANELEDIDSALQICLDKVCSVTGWPVGHVYLYCSNSNDLVPTRTWHLDDPARFRAFVEITEKTALNSGVGLPGRVFKTAKPAWIIDVTQDINFPRNKLAKDIAVKGGFAFPVLIKDEVVGVLEFFSSKAEEPDALLLEFMASVGVQLGRVIERDHVREAEERARINLEKRVQERTEELSRSNQELQNFAFIASHDLQEPLRKIVTLGDRLQSVAPDLNERGRDYLQRMQKSAGRLQCFIEDLLLFSRVTGKARQLEPTDLNKVVNEVLTDLEVRVAQTKGTVNVANLPTLPADPFQMAQLFQNLIGNALKFHKTGVPPVVNLSSSRDDQGNWEIKVEDNGLGFEEKYSERIFEPFERLHDRDSYDGTGMGLAICRKIVAQHDGEIVVKSVPSQGTTFFIKLREKLAAQSSPKAGSVVRTSVVGG